MPIHVAIHERVGALTLDRPRKAHAYDTPHLRALAAGLAQLVADGAVAVVIGSTGDGAFCGGADLDALTGKGPLDALDLLSQRVFDEIARAPVVTIAALHGAAVAGGCELALACDLRVVGPKARFTLPETRLGLIPAAGGCTRLPRLVGPSVAKQVILAGRSLSAEDAARFGLAIGPVDDARAEARALAERVVAHHDPVALRLAKGVIDADDDQASLQAERVAEALLYARRAERDAGRS
jgi:enoyl-CoA hydratase/carnithine racemase